MGKLKRVRILKLKDIEKILDYNGFLPITRGREIIFQDNIGRNITVERDECINPKIWMGIVKFYNLELPSKIF